VNFPSSLGVLLCELRPDIDTLLWNAYKKKMVERRCKDGKKCPSPLIPIIHKTRLVGGVLLVAAISRQATESPTNCYYNYV